jgi:hypothetical protein
MTQAYTPNVSDEKVLRAVGRYHYLTADQFLRLLYSRGSRTFVSEILARLTKAGYLHRGFVAQTDPGSDVPVSRGIWSATAKGRAFLGELGVPLLPNKHGDGRTPLYYDHIVPVNDALIACELFARHEAGVDLAQMVHEREIKRGPDRVELILSGKRVSTPVAADGWVDFRVNGYQHCIWWEVDRDTEHVRGWLAKIAGILEYYASGRYEEKFGTDSLTVAVVSVPRTGRSAAKRMWDLMGWTEQQLEHAGKTDWADVFRFTPINPAGVEPAEFFLGGRWIKPFDRTPASVLEGMG